MASEDDLRRLKEAGIPADKVDEYMAAFEMFDTNRQGKITHSMLKEVLNGQFGQTFSDEDIDYMLKQFSDDGQVTFEKFAKSLSEKMANPAYDEAFADAFDLLDSDKQGTLTKEKLQEGMKKLGENLTDEEADEMLKVASTKDDFVKLMRQGGGMNNAQGTQQASTGVVSASTAGGGSGGAAQTASTPAGGARPRPIGGQGPRPAANGSPRPAGPSGNGSPRPQGPGNNSPRPVASQGPRPAPRGSPRPRG
eukprot:gb/GECG01002872.1/.p1 GENE.gb/GECG01002872.1/~~gb/GECG01002872.1/.p1  ORF type:complete len:251 (+),score=50.15 gb/GECG01002872.1/:1-753(+)